MKNQTNNQKIKAIVAMFRSLNGSSFIGVREYRSKTSGEVANHVVCTNFSYGNAVNKDLQALKGANDNDVKAICEKFGCQSETVKIAIDKLIQAFEKNQNPETQSAQSKSQQDAYLKVCEGIKLHLETGLLHIYALAINKTIIVNGESKPVNSSALTLAQNAVKKYFNFSTSKYRQFIIEPHFLTQVQIQGETVSVV
jgi:hypothetical protein